MSASPAEFTPRSSTSSNANEGRVGADWYHNLKAEPNVSIEVGTDTVDVTVSEATGEERDRLYAAQAEGQPQFAEYATRTDRVIPVMALTPR